MPPTREAGGNTGDEAQPAASAEKTWELRLYVTGRSPACVRALANLEREAAGIVFEDTASALFGVEGLRVTDAQAGPGGVLEVWA